MVGKRATSKRDEARRELEELLLRPATDFKSWYLPEPALIFGCGAQAPDPKAGIRLHGPCGTPDDQPVTQIRVAIIGAGETVQEAQNWARR